MQFPTYRFYNPLYTEARYWHRSQILSQILQQSTHHGKGIKIQNRRLRCSRVWLGLNSGPASSLPRPPAEMVWCPDVLRGMFSRKLWGAPAGAAPLPAGTCSRAEAELPQALGIYLYRKHLLSHTGQTVTAFNKHYGRAIQWAGFPMVPKLLLISISA